MSHKEEAAVIVVTKNNTESTAGPRDRSRLLLLQLAFAVLIAAGIAATAAGAGPLSFAVMPIVIAVGVLTGQELDARSASPADRMGFLEKLIAVPIFTGTAVVGIAATIFFFLQ